MKPITRLIVVDPNLSDHVGHHAEYDGAVADAASAQGLSVQLLGHKNASEEIASDGRFLRVFSRDIWNGKRVAMEPDVARRVFLMRALQTLLVLPALVHAISLAARALGRWLPASPPPPPAQVPGRVAYLISLVAFLRDRISVPRSISTLFIRNPRFYFELRKALRQIRFSDADLVFAPMVLHTNLLEFALLASSLGDDPQVRLVLLLRYDAAFYRPRSLGTRLAWRMLERAFERGKLRMATDSERLAAEFARHSHVPFEVFPIPHTDFPLPGPGGTGKRKLRVGSLGNARLEKGFGDILQAIRAVNRKVQSAEIEFVLQANEPDAGSRSRLGEFLADRPGNVEVITEALGTKEYKALVASLDVVLVPYWQEVYVSRTSGIFMEAVAAGKPMIATRDTWMSDELARYASGIAVPSRQPDGLADAILALCDEIEHYRARAARAREQSLQRHSAPALMRQLLGQDRHRAEAPTSAVIIYPWLGFFTRHSGASLRTSLLADFLRDHGWSVTALISSASDVKRAEGVMTVLHAHEPLSPRANWPLALYVAAMRLATRGAARPGEWLFFFHRYWYRSRQFKRALNRAIASAGAVFVEYTFLASVVRPFADARRIPMIVTAHDVLANQISGSRWRRKLLELEAGSLRQADMPACVSEDDRETFAAAGVTATVVPNSIGDTASVEPAQARRLVAALGIPQEADFVVFFGSFNLPNIQAKRLLKEIAQLLRADPSIIVVVGGTCAHPRETEGNFIAVGLVDERTKAALYQRSLAVLNPMQNGTGTSLKVIEAMAYGKTVVGTTRGFRGYPVRHDIDAVVCDDLSRYAPIVRQLAGDDALRARLGENAKRFAGKYDYRAAYQPYLDFLTHWRRASCAGSYSL